MPIIKRSDYLVMQYPGFVEILAGREVANLCYDCYIEIVLDDDEDDIDTDKPESYSILELTCDNCGVPLYELDD